MKRVVVKDGDELASEHIRQFQILGKPRLIEKGIGGDEKSFLFQVLRDEVQDTRALHLAYRKSKK